MSRLAKGVLAASLLLGAWPAAAATAAKSKPAPVISGLSGVSAPNVRLAALVGPTGTVIRGKGITSVNHEFTGSYCVLPSSSLGIDVTSVVPAITVEYALSVGNFNIAQYASSSCTVAGRPGIRVVTQSILGGEFRNADAAFAIVVP